MPHKRALEPKIQMRDLCRCKKTYRAQTFSQNQIFGLKQAQLTYEYKNRNEKQLRLKQAIFQAV